MLNRAPNVRQISKKDPKKVGFSGLFKANTYSKGRLSMHYLRRYGGCSANPTYFLFSPTIPHAIRRLSAGKATRRRRQGGKQGRNVAQPRFDTLKHGGGSLSWKISPPPRPSFSRFGTNSTDKRAPMTKLMDGFTLYVAY